MAVFRKNKRQKPYTPPTAATVNPNAATAATAAFSLSSAAAGAALRALPAPRTNVAEVQTKRTMRRSASVSSQGSRRAMSPVPSIKRMMGMGTRGAAEGGPVRSAGGPPTLRRRGSNSSLASMASVTSMSERTFRTRTPSPGRGARGIASRHPATPASPGSSVASSRTSNKSAAATAAGAAAAAAIGRTGKSNRSQSMPPPPPVPSIPKHVAAATSGAGAKQQPQAKRKSMQLAQQPLRLASEQQAKGSRNTWFGGATVGNMGDVRKSDVAMDISNYGNKVSITPPDERPSSRASSINFSYPSRQRLASPPASPTTADAPTAAPTASQAVTRSMSTERPSTKDAATRNKAAALGGASGRRSVSMSRVMDRTTTTNASGETLVYDPNSRRFVPRSELLLEQSLAEAEEEHERQQRKKQQRHSMSTTSLDTLAKTSKTAALPRKQQPEAKQRPIPKPEAVAVATASPPKQQKQQRRPQKQKPQEPTAQERDVGTSLQSESAQPHETTAAVSPAAVPQTTTEPVVIVVPEQTGIDTVEGGDSSRPVLVKRPSVVHEETERELEASVAPVQVPESSASLSGTSPVAVENGHVDFVGSSTGGRLAVRRHSPPPRSVSPIKSAMKHSSSPRDVSPADSTSDANAASSTLQPTNSLTVQGAAARKKAHRVSFDEKAVVVPQESSQKPTFSTLPGAPETMGGNQTPAQRRTWFSNIGRSKKKGAELAAAAAGAAFVASSADEDDEIMKPRPALPSFGSVRQHAHAPPQEERPLVRPQASALRRSPSESPAASPSRDASVSSAADALGSEHLETQGASNDHAIGSILVSSLAGSSLEDKATNASTATRNTANTSRYREPLPPVVTSVDGSGYHSESDASIYSIDNDNENEGALLADEDEDEDNGNVGPRFDETRSTYPTVLPAVIAEVPSDEENASDAEPAAANASTAKSTKKAVPAIAITHPSQENLTAVRGTEDGEEEPDTTILPLSSPAPPPTRNSPVRAAFDVPGTFPDSDSDSTNKASPTKPSFGSGDGPSVPARQDVLEPVAQDDDSTVTAYTPSTVSATHMPTLHEESSLHEQQAKDNDDDDDDDDDKDDESIYSDAYEDLSDAEGGFQSLDAVVESPIAPNPKNQPFALPPVLPNGPPSPTSKRALSSVDGADFGGNSVAANAWHASTADGASEKSNASDPDWEKVRTFWHGLSSERRAQLEREANERAVKEEAAADGDLEETTAKKARRKKSVETRLAEKKALQEMTARNGGLQATAQSQSQPQPQSQTQPSTPKKISKRLRPSMRETATGTASGGAEADASSRPSPPRPQSAGGAVRMAPTRAVSSDSNTSTLVQTQKQTQKQSILQGTLRRRGSDSSESSFKRARGAGTQSDVGVSMKRTMRGESLDRGSSRFSLRSLSPTGSATVPSGGLAATQSTRMPRTMRDKAPGGGGARSFGQKSGGKLVRRGGSSRFGDSSDEDDVVSLPRPASAGASVGAVGGGASRRSLSVGGVTRAFRSRFDDSSDEDEVILDSRLRAATRNSRSTERHVVPKTLRSGGLRGSNSVGGSNSGGGGLSSKSLRSSDGGRPGSRGGLSKKKPAFADAFEEEEEDEYYRRPATAGAAVRPDAYMVRTASGNIGTSSLRRSRSGRGQLMPAAHTTALTSSSAAAAAATTTSASGGGGRGKEAAAVQGPKGNVQHGRKGSTGSSIMSVLRRKKPKDEVGGGSGGVGSFGSTPATTMKIQRGELSDSAVRRDTQLERSKQELAVLRSNSQRRRQLQRAGRATGDLDSDLDSDAGGGGSWPLTSGGGGKGKISDVDLGVPVKKKKFPALRRMFRLED